MLSSASSLLTLPTVPTVDKKNLKAVIWTNLMCMIATMLSSTHKLSISFKYEENINAP